MYGLRKKQNLEKNNNEKEKKRKISLKIKKGKKINLSVYACFSMFLFI